MTRPAPNGTRAPELWERVREARSEARPTGGVVVSLELLDEVAEELRRYSLLMQAVNESADDCDEKCDSHAHREDCKTHDPASWLIDARAENAKLRAALQGALDCRVNGVPSLCNMHRAEAQVALAAPPAAPEPTS